MASWETSWGSTIYTSAFFCHVAGCHTEQLWTIPNGSEWLPNYWKSADKNQLLDDHLSADARKIMDQTRSSKFKVWKSGPKFDGWSPLITMSCSHGETPRNWPQGSDNDPARRRPAQAMPATKGNGVRLKGDENQLDGMFNSIFVGQRDYYWILPTELDRKIYRTL